MESKKVSVIIPTYNKRDKIKFAINSALNQTYENIEILIIDDGSQDGTKEYVQKFHDERISYFYKKNGGLSDARNYGIKKSTGDYLLFLDSDDFLEENTIKYLMDLMCEYNVDLVQMQLKIVKDYDNKKHDANMKNISYKQYKKDCVYHFLRLQNVSACTKLYKRECYDNVSFPIYKKYEDFYTNYLIFKNIKSFINTNFYGYFYVKNGKSITRSSLTISDFDLYKLIKELIDLEDDKILSDLLLHQLLLAEISLMIKGIKYGFDSLYEKEIFTIIKRFKIDLKNEFSKCIKSNIIPINKKIVILPLIFLPYKLLIKKYRRKII